MAVTDPITGMSTVTAVKADYDSIIDEDPALFKKMMRSNGIYERTDLEWFDTFYRFPRMDPYNTMGPLREYVFFVKPDLHIFQNESDRGTLNTEIATVPFFADLMRRGYGETVLRELQYSADTTCPFVRLLSNAKQSNLDLAGISVDDVETASNMYGTKMFYRKASDHSDEEADFTIEFEDSRWLEVYLWFKAFDEYERKKFQGKVSPPHQWYTEKKILHDQMAIFKFLVDEDGESIVHYSRLQGCYPKSVPRDSFSDPTDGNFKFTTHWKSTFQKDMDPIIITHFNYLASLAKSRAKNTLTEIPLWDDSIQGITGENVLVPYISLDASYRSHYSRYKLRWLG